MVHDQSRPGAPLTFFLDLNSVQIVASAVFCPSRLNEKHTALRSISNRCVSQCQAMGTLRLSRI